MESFWKTIWTAFEDRAKSKFWPTFTFVWAIHNWDFLYILIFSPFTETKDSVGRLATIYNNHWSFIGVPFLWAAFLVLTIPWVDTAINWWQKKAIFISKTIAIDLATEIAEHKARQAGRQASAIQDAQVANKIIQEAAEKELPQDLKRFRRLDAVLTESNIREMLSEYKNRDRFTLMPSLEKYLIEGKLIVNKFTDQETRLYHDSFLTALDELSKSIRENMAKSSTSEIYQKDLRETTPDNNQKSLKVEEALIIARDSYLNYRELIHSRYGE